MGGFYLMHRGWLDHPVFGSRKREPFDRRSAWCWMIEEAAFEPRQVRVAGKIVTLERGQFSHSLRFMADAWGWQHDRCRRFLKELSHVAMIATASATGDATGQMLITICNYERYQGPKSPGATDDAIAYAVAVRQRCDSSATDLKELKESKQKEDSPSNDRAKGRAKGSIEAEFAEFYQAYPRRVGRAAAQRKYVIARQTADAETLLTAAKRFAEISAGKEPQFVAHPATWLHNGRWQDEDLQAPVVNEWHDTGPDEPPPIAPWRVTAPTGVLN